MEHQGRQQTETYQIRKRVQFLSDRGECIQHPGAEPVTEVTQGGGEHEHEREVQPPFESTYHTYDPAQEVHRCDSIRNVTDNIHSATI